MIPLALFLAASSGQFVSGAILKDWCDRKVESCHSFILGVTDTAITIAPNAICLRPHVNPEELRMIVLDKLNAAPSSAGYGAAQYVLIALREQFPCPNSN